MEQTTIPAWLANEAAAYDLPLQHPPATILDIGANIGAFSLWARQRWPGAKIEAYEPVPANAEQFRRNCPGVTLHEAAVRSVFKDDTMFLGDRGQQRGDTGVADSFYDLGFQTKETVAVKCVAASSLAAAEFVKVDTEGCEVEILSSLWLQYTTALVVEYHRLADSEIIIGIAQKAGLELAQHEPDEQGGGVLKFARPGSLVKTSNPIPDTMLLHGRTADGVNITAPALVIRNPCMKASLRHVKLFIGLPVYQKVDSLFLQCLLALQARKPCPIEVHITQGDGIARARNELTARFLRSDCTHLLFIDCDLIFDADHIACLLERDLPVVGGFYAKKQEGRLDWVINTLVPNPPRLANELQEVKYAGTGFLCIKREVFEQMAAAYPESEYREDYGGRGIAHEFWPMTNYGPGSAIGRLERARKFYDAWESGDEDANGKGIQYIGEILNGKCMVESRYLSEDWYFCQRWLDMGGRVWMDCRVVLRHIGTAIYPLKTQEDEINGPAV